VNLKPSAARRVAALLISGAMAAAMIASGCSRKSAPAGFGEHGAVPVLVAKAVETTVATRITAIGRVEAYSTVDIKAQVDAQVMQVHFKEGQMVRKGDLLFTLDRRPFEAALRQVQANLAKDKAQAAQASADEQRYAYLLKQGVGSQQQYDQAHATAGAETASVAADEAAVQTARLNLAYTEIRAPIDGRTGDLLVHAGNLVKANADTAMVVINQIQPVYVDFSVPESQLADVRRYVQERQLPVEVSVPGQKKAHEDGVLSFIDNTVNQTTGTIMLKGLFANKDSQLWPGQFVNTALVLNERPNTIVIPAQAVQSGIDGSYVFVVNPHMKAETRTVAVGTSTDGHTVVESGLKAGETVVTDGQLRLVPGMTVTIKQGLGAPGGKAS
jgi:multidrug efflux system membrane fusion protein